MKSQEEVEDAYEYAKEMSNRLDDEEHHLESIAPAIIAKTLGWVVEEEGSMNLLEDLEEDIESEIESDELL